MLTVLERIMARCGRQSPHRVSPHCFIAVGILNIEHALMNVIAKTTNKDTGKE